MRHASGRAAWGDDCVGRRRISGLLSGGQLRGCGELDCVTASTRGCGARKQGGRGSRMTGGPDRSRVFRPRALQSQAFQLWCVRLWLWVQNAGLTMAEGLFFRGQRRAPSPKSVLIYRTGRLGDFLNAVPAMAALRARLPQARIALLTTASTDRSAEKAALAYGGGAQALPWLRLVSPSLVD